MKRIFKGLCVLLLIFIVLSSNVLAMSMDESNNKKNIVYITFDDGPTKKVCSDILDILNDYQIKATFFVVGKEISGREDVLNRMYNEGHSIGLHTYSHNNKIIYKSNKSFVREMVKTQEKVKMVTGCTSNIIRFPWGSNNQYRKLNKTMLNLLHDKNFRIYDWTCDTKDGMCPEYSSSKLVSNSRKIRKDYDGNIIILMHCNSTNKNTVKALPKIIEQYRDMGYEFKPITEDTPEYYHLHKK